MLPSGQTLPECLEERGVSRRAFLSFCGVMAATLALPASYRTQIAEALASVRRPVVIWRQFQDCAGNSESILRSPHPDVAEIVLETLGVELPRADHGRLGRSGRGAEHAGRARPQGAVHRGDRGRDSDW